MHALGPGEPALSEWREMGLRPPDMDIVRAHRLARVQAELQSRNIAGVVLFDPLNIRYATDSTNMQLWITHNAARYCFIGATGPVIVFDYHSCEHLSAHNALIDEVRPATSWFYFSSGDRLAEKAEKWAAEIADLAKSCGGQKPRLAVDRINPEGARALAELGVEVCCGEEVMETARMVKCAEEVQAMRCAVAACDKAIDVMRQHAAPRCQRKSPVGVFTSGKLCPRRRMDRNAHFSSRAAHQSMVSRIIITPHTGRRNVGV